MVEVEARPDALTARALTAADVPGYRALMLEAYACSPDAFTSTPQERASASDAWWARRVADPTGFALAFGAFQGPALVGTVALEFSSKPKTRHKVQLIGMYVGPQARGQGVGRRLVETALDFTRARPDATVVALTVTQGNAVALALYEDVGFVSFGLEPRALRTADGYLAKLHMWLDLRA